MTQSSLPTTISLEQELRAILFSASGGISDMANLEISQLLAAFEKHLLSLPSMQMEKIGFVKQNRKNPDQETHWKVVKASDTPKIYRNKLRTQLIKENKL